MTSRTERVLLITLSLAKLWIVAARTLTAYGWSAVDDFWFLRIARLLLAGRWLGAYDETTLIKGIGYPLFVAAMDVLHVPLLIAQQIFYVVACFAVWLALRPAVHSAGARVAMFAILMFNPMCFAEDLANRAIREAIYHPQSLLVAAGVGGALLRRREPLRRVMPWIVLAGVSLTWLWHTREEGIWIAPLVAIPLAALLFRSWPDRRRMLAIGGVPAAMFAIVYAAIAITNGVHYGIYTTVEFKQHSFLRAYGALISVRQHPAKARVAVTKEARERIYAVSPAFAELRPSLEGDPGARWASAAPRPDREIATGMFMWAFRDAVARAGYYARGGPAVTEYYERLAREIRRARDDNRLDARKLRATMAPPLLWGQRREVLLESVYGLASLARFRTFWMRHGYSEGTDQELALYREMTHEVLAPRKPGAPFVRITGRATYRNAPLALSVERRDGTPVFDATVNTLPGGRFSVFTPVWDAWLVMRDAHHVVDRVPLSYEMHIAAHNPELRLSVDSMTIDVPQIVISPSVEFRYGVMNAIGTAFQVAFLPLSVFALGAYAWTRAWRGRPEVTVLLLGIFGAVLLRTLLLALIQVTSFDIYGRYESPGHALLILGVSIAAYEAWRTRTSACPPDQQSA